MTRAEERIIKAIQNSLAGTSTKLDIRPNAVIVVPVITRGEYGTLEIRTAHFPGLRKPVEKK